MTMIKLNLTSHDVNPVRNEGLWRNVGNNDCAEGGTNSAMNDEDGIENMTVAMSLRRRGYEPSRTLLEPSPVVVALVVLIVFILSPMILCGNSLILTAMYRFKRLRTPSNYLITSLASSDLGAGIFLPLGVYMELTSEHSSPSSFCIIPYCFAVCVCSASVSSLLLYSSVILIRYNYITSSIKSVKLLCTRLLNIRFILIL